jgi:predicted GNAT family acetyltransferase
MDNKYTIRKTAIEDINLLVRHHSSMFKEIMELQEKDIILAEFQKMEDLYRKKLNGEMDTGVFTGWVVEVDNVIIASGAVSICSMVPTPDTSSYLRAYIHSIFTEKEHRHKQLALTMMLKIKKHCANNGITNIFLSASDAGRQLYEKIGFKKNNSFMHYDSSADETC